MPASNTRPTRNCAAGPLTPLSTPRAPYLERGGGSTPSTACRGRSPDGSSKEHEHRVRQAGQRRCAQKCEQAVLSVLTVRHSQLARLHEPSHAHLFSAPPQVPVRYSPVVHPGQALHFWSQCAVMSWKKPAAHPAQVGLRMASEHVAGAETKRCPALHCSATACGTSTMSAIRAKSAQAWRRRGLIPLCCRRESAAY